MLCMMGKHEIKINLVHSENFKGLNLNNISMYDSLLLNSEKE